MWLRSRQLTFRKEALMRLPIEIEMATIDSIVVVATFSATVLGVQAYHYLPYCVDKVRQRVLLTMDGLKTAAIQSWDTHIMLFEAPIILCSNSPTQSQLCSLFYTYYALGHFIDLYRSVHITNLFYYCL